MGDYIKPKYQIGDIVFNGFEIGKVRDMKYSYLGEQIYLIETRNVREIGTVMEKWIERECAKIN